MYDRNSPLCSVNELRKKLFCIKNRSIDRMPPTKEALLQHTRRELYQAGIWTTSTQNQQMIFPPQQYAWTKVGESWVPEGITIPGVSGACRELIRRSYIYDS